MLWIIWDVRRQSSVTHRCRSPPLANFNLIMMEKDLLICFTSCFALSALILLFQGWCWTKMWRRRDNPGSVQSLLSKCFSPNQPGRCWRCSSKSQLHCLLMPTHSYCSCIISIHLCFFVCLSFFLAFSSSNVTPCSSFQSTNFAPSHARIGLAWANDKVMRYNWKVDQKCQVPFRVFWDHRYS